MVGAGNLIRLMFGLSYELAVVIVGVVMLAYVLFGGMIATTWVQIVKAALLLVGAPLLAVLVLAQFHFEPDGAVRRGRREVRRRTCLRPASWSSTPLDAISLGLALMFGTGGLPHILMRFYTVPDARAARRSVFYATGLHRLLLSDHVRARLRRHGARRARGDHAPSTRAATWPRRCSPKCSAARAFLGFIAAVAFATILAVVAGLTLSGAAALSHDLWVNVVRAARPIASEQLRVARAATVVLGVVAIALGIAFKGQNVAFMVGLAFAIAASANFPALLLSMFWRRLHHARRGREHA